MPRVKRRVYVCPDCQGVSDPGYLTELGGKVREYFTDRDGRPIPAVIVTSVLCWWCREYHHPGEVDACMALERPKAATEGNSSSFSNVKMPPWLLQFPELWEFLTKPLYKDGSTRQLGKISFGLNSGGIQVTLSDPSSSTYCSRAYSTLEDALLDLEVRLGDGSLTWRPSGPQRGKKRP